MTEQDANANGRKTPKPATSSRSPGADAGRATTLLLRGERSAAETIVDIAATLGASRSILGAPRRHAMVNLLRGNVIREVSDMLPEEIDLLVYA